MSKLNNKALSTFLLLSLFICLFSVFSIKNTNAEIEWYDTRYLYRKQINFYGSYQALTNYTAKIFCYKGIGSDIGQTVYLNSFADTELKDLVFTSLSNVKTNRYVDLQDFNTVGSSLNYTVYVRIPSLPANATTSLFAYWGIETYSWTETNISYEARNTFIFWDDFDCDYNIGDNPHNVYGQEWSTWHDTNATYPDNFIEVIANPYSTNGGASNQVMRIAETGSVDTFAPVLYANLHEELFDLECNFIASFLNENGVIFVNFWESTKCITNQFEPVTAKKFQVYYSSAWHDTFTINDDEYYWVTCLSFDDNALDYDVIGNGTSYDADWNLDPSNGLSIVEIYPYYNANELYLDRFFVRINIPSGDPTPLIVSTGNLNESEYIILINQQYRTMMLSLFFGGFIMFFGGLTVLFKFKPKLDLSFACIFIIVLGLCFIIAGGN